MPIDNLIDFAYLLDTPAPPQPDAVIGKGRMTILRGQRGTATKRFTPTKVINYSIGKYFHVEEKPVNSIFDMADVLLSIQSDPKAIVIRGTPIGPQRNHVLRRSRGEDATFVDNPCHWVCLDLDGVETHGGAPAAEVRHLVESSPQLAGTTCVCQLSASWGIKSGLRAHLWFWLEKPRTSQQVSEWASGLPFKVDHSLFGPVQPHYTADPIFEDVTDPMVHSPRVFVLKGAASDSLYVPEGTAQAEMDHWISAIGDLEDDDPRHPLINRAAYSLGGWVGAGALVKEDVEEALFTACLDSGVFEPARLDTIKREIASGVNDGALRPRQCEDWKSGLIRNKDGAIKALPENFLKIFQSHPAMAGTIGYDVRTDQPVLLKAPPWPTNSDVYPRSLRDADDVKAAAWVNRIGVHSSAVGHVSNALSAAAEANPIDRVVGWIDNLPPWDRVPRLFSWLPQITGCPSTRYTDAVGGRFLISLVARALRPGCKVDNMLVLVGPQGALKSTLLQAIVSGPGKWAFSDCLGDIRKPQDYMPTLMGPWLVEVAELSQFSKREVESVKKFLSTQTDRYRLSYGRRAVDIPRRGCIAGTSNTDDFLSDASGNRRFWPIDVKKLDIGAFKKIRDQVFAEALYEYRQGQKWYMTGEEVVDAQEAQTAHTAVDPWEDRIRTYLDEPPVFGTTVDDGGEVKRIMKTSVGDIIQNCLQIPMVQASHVQTRRVGAILKRLGWEHKRLVINRRQRIWMYCRPEDDYENSE